MRVVSVTTVFSTHVGLSRTLKKLYSHECFPSKLKNIALIGAWDISHHLFTGSIGRKKNTQEVIFFDLAQQNHVSN